MIEHPSQQFFFLSGGAREFHRGYDNTRRLKTVSTVYLFQFFGIT